jgi:hypothetical protein
MTHASLAANQGAAISLQDPRTGTIFYVESNGHTLVAMSGEGRVLWTADVPPGASSASEDPVRHLRLDGDTLWATCGKSSAYAVTVGSGKVRDAGSD